MSERQQVARGRLHGSPERQQARVSRGLRYRRPSSSTSTDDLGNSIETSFAKPPERLVPIAAKRLDLVQGKPEQRRAAGERAHIPHGAAGRIDRVRRSDDAEFSSGDSARERRRRRVHVRLEHPDECRFGAVQLPPHLVRHHPDRREIVAVENECDILVAERFTLLHSPDQCIQRRRGRGHARHPFRIFSHCASATLAACGVVEIFVGHGRVKPSLGHFRVASMPILLP